MLGEAARTGDYARDYCDGYCAALERVGRAADSTSPVTGPGFSVKLSALHPRCELAQFGRLRRELAPRVLELARLAREHNLGLTIDAEEAHRLDLSLAIFAGQVSAALVTGNAVLAKPAEQTTLTVLRVVQLFHQAGVPTPVLQVVAGPGQPIGRRLLPDPRIAGVLFTGSGTAAHAHAIAHTLAQRDGERIPLIAETGGQNAMVVDSTALLEKVVDDATRAGLLEPFLFREDDFDQHDGSGWQRRADGRGRARLIRLDIAGHYLYYARQLGKNSFIYILQCVVLVIIPRSVVSKFQSVFSAIQAYQGTLILSSGYYYV